MRDHKKLAVFSLADQLAFTVYTLTQSFPVDERFGLTSQLRRAAISVPTNIVEGAARSSSKEFARFLNVAYGSARELQYQISLSTRLQLVDELAARPVSDLAERTSKALHSLILSLGR